MYTDRYANPRTDFLRFSQSTATSPRSNLFTTPITKNSIRSNYVNQSARGSFFDQEAVRSIQQKQVSQSSEYESIIIKYKETVLLLENDIQREKLLQTKLSQQISEQQFQNQQLNNLIQTLNQEKLELQNKLLSCESIIKNSTNEKKKMTETLANVQKVAEKKAQDSNIKESQLKEWESSFKNSTEKNIQLVQQASELNVEILNLKSENSQLKNQISNLNEQFENLKQTQSQLQLKVQEQKQIIKERKLKFQSKEFVINQDFQEQIKNMKANFEQEKQYLIQQFNTKIQDLNNEAHKQNKIIIEQSTLNESLQQKINTSEEDLKLLFDQLSNLKRENFNLKRTIEEQTIDKQISLNKEKTNSETKQQEWKANVKQQEQQNNHLKEQISFLEQEKKKQQDFLKKMEELVRQDEEYIIELTEKIEDLNNQVLELEKDHETILKENISLKNLIHKSEEERQLLEDEVSQIRYFHENFRKQNKSLDEALKVENKELRQKIRALEKQSESKNWNQEKIQMQETIEFLNINNKRLKKQCKLAEQRTSEIQKAFNNLKSKKSFQTQNLTENTNLKQNEFQRQIKEIRVKKNSKQDKILSEIEEEIQYLNALNENIQIQCEFEDNPLQKQFAENLKQVIPYTDS